jgi:hypothetical protein
MDAGRRYWPIEPIHRACSGRQRPPRDDLQRPTDQVVARTLRGQDASRGRMSSRVRCSVVSPTPLVDT